MVPHLLTALKGPLLDLERRILDATPRIERWFRLEWQEHTPPFYCSVDLRNAGFKLAPVETRLFPRGFDLLSKAMLPLAVQAAMAAIEKYCPDARNLLLIPDNDTSDPSYLTHLGRLAAILRQTGLHVRLGSLDRSLETAQPLRLPDGQTLLLEPLERRGRRLGVKNFDPCSILLNNDLSAGVAPILDGLHEQVLLPPLHAGRSTRRKSNHFDAYAAVVKRFARLIDVDPWLVSPLYGNCGRVDPISRNGQDSLVRTVESVLRQLRTKYREYGVEQAPFVVIKADAGDSGSWSSTVRSAADVRSLPHCGRPGASSDNTGSPVDELLVQEGIQTFETLDSSAAVPVVYMVDRFVIGGYYRLSVVRQRDQNRNDSATRIVPLPFDTSCVMPDAGAAPDSAPNRFYAYGVVARLALLAASIELEQTDPDQSLYG